MTSGVLADSSCSRSWFSATEPPTSAPAGSADRSRSTVAPTAWTDGSVFGIACTSAAPSAPLDRRHDLGDARVGLGQGGHACASPCVVAIWSAPGAPAPNACWTCV